MIYFEPELKILSISTEDIIRTSNDSAIDHGRGDELLPPDPY